MNFFVFILDTKCFICFGKIRLDGVLETLCSVISEDDILGFCLRKRHISFSIMMYIRV